MSTQRVHPVVIDGFVKPGFMARVYTCLLYQHCMVLCRTGSINPHNSGSVRAAMGGNVGDAMLLGAIASIFDSFTRGRRIKQVADIANSSPEQIAALDKRNILLPYSSLQRVETRGINFAGEAKVSIFTGTQRYKFRLSGQSKGSFQYVVDILSEHLGEKHVQVSRRKSKSQ